MGEETKRKIAIEKERQERLKSLEARFSKKSSMKNSTSSNWHSLEGFSNETLDDTSTGYIVNFVRDEGEDPVRRPPSISAKLKSHQDGPDILVCDEVHIIKNTKADVTQALKQVRCQTRIALT